MIWWSFSKRSKSMNVATATNKTPLVNGADAHHNGYKKLLHFQSLNNLLHHKPHAVRHKKPDLSQIVLIRQVTFPLPSIESEEDIPDDDLAQAIYWHQKDDLILSAHYLIRAAQQPNPLVALYLLGVVVREGFGVKVNQKLAFDLLVEAAIQTRDLIGALRPYDPAVSWLLEGEGELCQESDFDVYLTNKTNKKSNNMNDQPLPQSGPPTIELESLSVNSGFAQKSFLAEDMWSPVSSQSQPPLVMSAKQNHGSDSLENTSQVSNKTVKSQPFVIGKLSPHSPQGASLSKCYTDIPKSSKNQPLVLNTKLTNSPIVESSFNHIKSATNSSNVRLSTPIHHSYYNRNTIKTDKQRSRKLGALNSLSESVLGLAAWITNDAMSPSSEPRAPIKEEDIQAVRSFMPLPILEISHCYRHSYGIRKSKCAAIYHLHFAACLGDPDAQSELGITYLEAFGVHRSKMKAAKWLRLAAEQGVIIPNESWIWKSKWNYNEQENHHIEEHHAIRAKKVIRPPQ